MKRLTLPKKKRLFSNDQFRTIMDNGRNACNGFLILYMAENNCGFVRLGVSVGKIQGNAVTRNRLKRLLREVFRQNQEKIPGGFDYLLMPSRRKRAENSPTFAEVEKSFLTLVDTISKNRISRGK
ncbi:MAG: ribonuclease P protein component [Sedimentisphaerales bacterium]|nr:ribonuclease P protein component [Sedimentisphaerales bacterium]